MNREQRESAGRAEIQRTLEVSSKRVQKLDVVLKTDSMGTREAIVSAIEALNVPDLNVEAHADVGIFPSQIFSSQRQAAGWSWDSM
jgi:translation initiation factor IF-2